MTYDEIMQLTAEAVGKQLTEKELDALAQAITLAEDGKIEAIIAGAVICWLMAAERIAEGQDDTLIDIVRRQMKRDKEDEKDESVRAD